MGCGQTPQPLSRKPRVVPALWRRAASAVPAPVPSLQQAPQAPPPKAIHRRKQLQRVIGHASSSAEAPPLVQGKEYIAAITFIHVGARAVPMPNTTGGSLTHSARAAGSPFGNHS